MPHARSMRCATARVVARTRSARAVVEIRGEGESDPCAVEVKSE